MEKNNNRKPIQKLVLINFKKCVLTFIVIWMCFSSCNSYQKLLKSSDFDLKKAKAKEYYNEGIFDKAIPLFEEIIPFVKGQSKEAEDWYYYFPYCYYGQGDYLFAAFYFKQFIDYYPRAARAEDARFMIAYCNYKMSPEPPLEQTNTEKAIEQFQLFVNTYPNSERVEECNELIDQLRRKLEKKAFLSANLYYRVKDYRAAAVAFENLLIDFPETPEREKVQFLIVKSYYLLAENSIVKKQEERYNLAVSSYYSFVDKYPNSSFIKEAEKIFENSNTQLDEIKSNNL